MLCAFLVTMRRLGQHMLNNPIHSMKLVPTMKNQTIPTKYGQVQQLCFVVQLFMPFKRNETVIAQLEPAYSLNAHSSPEKY